MDPSTIIMLVILGVALIVIMFVMPRLRGKNQQTTINTLHSLVVPGAVVKTIGGIIGTIVDVKQISPKEKIFVLQTGEEPTKTTMTFDMAALYTIVTLATGEKFTPAMLAPKPKSQSNSSAANATTSKEVVSESDNVNASEAKAEDVFVDTVAQNESVQEPSNDESDDKGDSLVSVK